MENELTDCLCHGLPLSSATFWVVWLHTPATGTTTPDTFSEESVVLPFVQFITLALTTDAVLLRTLGLQALKKLQQLSSLSESRTWQRLLPARIADSNACALDIIQRRPFEKRSLVDTKRSAPATFFWGELELVSSVGKHKVVPTGIPRKLVVASLTPHNNQTSVLGQQMRYRSGLAHLLTRSSSQLQLQDSRPPSPASTTLLTSPWIQYSVPQTLRPAPCSPLRCCTSSGIAARSGLGCAAARPQ